MFSLNCIHKVQSNLPIETPHFNHSRRYIDVTRTKLWKVNFIERSLELTMPLYTPTLHTRSTGDVVTA